MVRAWRRELKKTNHQLAVTIGVTEQSGIRQARSIHQAYLSTLRDALHIGV
jgi:hypothetical protein